ncbi:MAG: GAF domain-containing protein [Sphingomonadales bacterium]|nr:GAF domain-containing protein [Sphingomonadales bacterium]
MPVDPALSAQPADHELRRLNWALQAYARSARALMRARSFEQMARRVCEAISAHDEYVIAAIAMTGPSPEKAVRFIATSGPAREYLDGLLLTWSADSAAGMGPTGRGLRSGEPWIVDDALTDPVFSTWLERAQPYGLRSSITVPFGRDGDRAVGAVVVYASVPHAFSPREVKIFQELGEELLFARGILADQQRLEEARQAQAAAEADSRRRQAEVARIARALTVGEFAASISHEITQPLAATITNVETALRYLAPGRDKVDAARAALQRALRDAERAGAVIRETRRQIAREDGDFAACDLNRIINDVLTCKLDDLDAAGITVHADLAAQPLTVMGSAIQLEQVILNLVMNAREALHEITGRERRIDVRSCRETDGSVSVSVLDNGPGMTEETRGRVFEHFFTTKQTGMGMGLAISRSIIEAHGGSLRCEDGDGWGIRFRITLPAAEGGAGA